MRIRHGLVALAVRSNRQSRQQIDVDIVRLCLIYVTALVETADLKVVVSRVHGARCGHVHRYAGFVVPDVGCPCATFDGLDHTADRVVRRVRCDAIRVCRVREQTLCAIPVLNRGPLQCGANCA